jgi:hypothetical protein
MRTGRGRLLVAVLAVLATALPARALTPETVIGTKADEWNPAASPGYVAWNVSGKLLTAYAKPFGGTKIRLSREGWEGNVGGISGSRVLFQEYRYGDEPGSDIYLYDFETQRRMKVRDPVSTDGWEYDGDIDGNLIAFARWYRSRDRKLFLFDRVTKEVTLVASTEGKQRTIDEPQINGDHVAYEIYIEDQDGYTSCNVYRYQISTRTTVRIPNRNEKCQYAPSIDDQGTVYYARGGMKCGADISLMAYPIGGPPETLVTLPGGRDLWSSYAVDNDDGSVDVYFDPWVCGKQADIRRVTIPA